MRIIILIIISGSYLWLWNRHRPVTMGTVRNVQNHSVVCHDGVLDNLRKHFMFLAFKVVIIIDMGQRQKSA